MKTSCEIIPTVTRPDGEQVKSKLYVDLQGVLPKGEVRNFYELIKSEQFKTHTNYAEFEKDENDEPTLQALFEHTPLNKRINDTLMSEKLIHRLGIRQVDNLGHQDVGNAIAKIIMMNDELKDATNGEQYFRVALVRKYNPNTKRMYLEPKVYRTNKHSDMWDYQLETFATNLAHLKEEITSWTTIDELLYKALQTFPMGISDVETFNPDIMINLVKETQDTINNSTTPVNTLNISINSSNYNRVKNIISGISTDDWLAFIESERLPINKKEFEENPNKFKGLLLDTLFAKYQLDHAITDLLSGVKDRRYLNEMMHRLNNEVTNKWKNIELPDPVKEFNIDDTLITKPEDDPLYIDTEAMIKELGDKYDVEKKSTIGAKELLAKIIEAEQNQLHIQNRLETNAKNTEIRNKKNLVKILTTWYEDANYETALYEYYNHIISRIKEWKNIVNTYDNSINNAKNLRQAHLELVMFHEISDFVRRYKDEITLDKKRIKNDIIVAVADYMNIDTYEDMETFMQQYKKDPMQFCKDYPELEMFAQAYFEIDNLDESKGIADIDEKIVPLIKDLEDVLNAKIKAYTVNFLKEYQDPEAEIIPFGKKKGQTNDIEQLLTYAERDMNGFERLLDALGDSPDMILRLLDKVAKTAKNTARINAIKMAKEIQAEAKILENAGIKDTKWMFHRDENGNKTGRYIMNGDPEMNEINSNPAKLRFYNFFMNAKSFFDGMYPPSVTRIEKIISINKDLLERLRDSESIIDMKNEYLESLKDEWYNRSADSEDAILGFTQGGYTLNGEEINVLPIFYQNVEFGNKQALNNISEDAVSTLIAYGAKAVDYNESNKIINKMELARLTLNQRQIPVKRNGINIATKISKQLQSEQDNTKNVIYYKDDGKSNLSQRLGGFMDVVFYAKARKDDVNVGKFSAVKIVDKLNAWTARAAMSLSLLNSISNVTTGNMMMTYEALSKHYFKPKDLLWADTTYSTNIVPLLGNLGNRIKDDKLSLFNELFDITQKYDKDQYRNVKWDRKSKAGRIEFGEALMFMQDAGEHWMANRTALCIAHTTILKDSNGESHDLWDSLEVEYMQEDGETYGSENKGLGARLKIKDGYTKEDGTEFTDNDFVRLQLKIASINQGMHGIYNKIDSNMIQMTAIGRLAYIFRKWIWKSYSKRFEDINYNYNTQEWNEGYYRSCWHFIKELSKDLKNGKIDIALHWNELHPTEQANCKKAIYETGIYLSIMGINAFVDWGDDDGDDNWFKNMFSYQLIRLQSELGALTPIGAIPEFIRLAKSPIPALNTINNTMDVLKACWIPNWFEEVDRGWAKGYSKGFKYLMNSKVLNPYFLTYQKTFNELEEQIKWYMQ